MIYVTITAPIGAEAEFHCFVLDTLAAYVCDKLEHHKDEQERDVATFRVCAEDRDAVLDSARYNGLLAR